MTGELIKRDQLKGMQSIISGNQSGTTENGTALFYPLKKNIHVFLHLSFDQNLKRWHHGKHPTEGGPFTDLSSVTVWP